MRRYAVRNLFSRELMVYGDVFRIVQCYDEVRRETNALRASLKTARNGLPHNKATDFLYENESPRRPDSYAHRVDRKRPSWFPLELLGIPSSSSK